MKRYRLRFSKDVLELFEGQPDTFGTRMAMQHMMHEYSCKYLDFRDVVFSSFKEALWALKCFFVQYQLFHLEISAEPLCIPGGEDKVAIRCCEFEKEGNDPRKFLLDEAEGKLTIDLGEGFGIETVEVEEIPEGGA